MGNAYEHFSTSLSVLHLHPDYISASPGHLPDKRTSAKHCARLQSFSLCELMLEESLAHFGLDGTVAFSYFNQSGMRDHLLLCSENMCLTPFSNSMVSRKVLI